MADAETENDIKLILKFLEWRKYPTPKSLENPTVNDIIDIWNCVIQYTFLYLEQ